MSMTLQSEDRLTLSANVKLPRSVRKIKLALRIWKLAEGKATPERAQLFFRSYQRFIRVTERKVSPFAKLCPKCGSDDVGRGHHNSFAFGECYFDQCNECEHQWGHA